MRRFAAVVGVLWLLLGVLISIGLISRLVSESRQIAFTSVDCPQPCWNGIQPGQTTLAETIDRLNADPTLRITSAQSMAVCWESAAGRFRRGCAYTWRGLGVQNDRIQVLDLFTDGAFRLGDALLSFGAPVAYQPYCGAANGNVYFGGSIITVLPVGGTRLLPTQPIMYVSYVSTGTTWYSTFTPLWHGFRQLPAKRLC